MIWSNSQCQYATLLHMTMNSGTCSSLHSLCYNGKQCINKATIHPTHWMQKRRGQQGEMFLIQNSTPYHLKQWLSDPFRSCVHKTILNIISSKSNTGETVYKIRVILCIKDERILNVTKITHCQCLITQTDTSGETS